MDAAPCDCGDVFRDLRLVQAAEALLLIQLGCWAAVKEALDAGPGARPRTPVAGHFAEQARGVLRLARLRHRTLPVMQRLLEAASR